MLSEFPRKFSNIVFDSPESYLIRIASSPVCVRECEWSDLEDMAFQIGIQDPIMSSLNPVKVIKFWLKYMQFPVATTKNEQKKLA